MYPFFLHVFGQTKLHLHMDSSSSVRKRPDFVKIIAGLLIARLVFHILNRNNDDDNDTYSYVSRHRSLDDAVGEEGLHASDLFDDVENGECISRNVIGEFTGDLTEEQETCITYTKKAECIEPCLWYTPDREAVDMDLADIDDDAAPKVCMREPVDGVCAPGFELNEDGCCTLPLSELPSVGDIAIDIGLDIAKGEACSLIIALSPAILKFLAGEPLSPRAAKAVKAAFKAMKMAATGGRVVLRLQARLATKMGAKFGAAKGGKIAARLGAKLAGGLAVRKSAMKAMTATAKIAGAMAKRLGIQFATRSASKLLSMAAKATGVITAPLLVFDIYSLLLDLGDPRGYNTFAENAVIQQAREVSEYELQKFAKGQEIEYPFTFPLNTAFPAAWDTIVTPALEKRYLNKAMMRLADDHIMLVFEALLDETDFPDAVADSIGVNLLEEMNRDPNDRDDEVYRVLTSGQVVTGTRWIDTGRSKPATGRQITDPNLIQRLESKIPQATTNLGLARAVKRFGGLLDNLPFMSTEEDVVNPFTEDIRLLPDEVPMKSTGKPFTFDAYTYVELNGKYYVSSDIGVPGRFVHRCKHMTTAKRQGVSLSMEGVKWWNAWHKEEWFRYNDLFQRPPDMPETYEASPVALWSTEYLVLDEENPGTSDKPNMKVRKLSKPAALYLPAGHIVAYCEKKRDAAFFGGLMGQEVPDMNSGVDPTDYGVYFDDGTGELGGLGCVYTSNYCSRMGLKHKYNHQNKESDCFMDAGQGVSEFIIGTTIHRGVYEGAHNLLGFVCDPGCNVTEFCEWKKCWPKQEYGKRVGISGGWKCLSGAENWGTCTECRVEEDCDGHTKETSKNKIDCENGGCFCNHETHCSVKIANGQPNQGSFANCKSGHDHDGNCVECWDSSHCDGDNVCLSNTCSAKIANGQPDQGSYTNCASGHNHDGNCVDCWDSSHCDGDNVCLSNTCSAKIANGQPNQGSYTNCASGHDHDGNCVDCWDSSHCTGGNVCLSNTCSAKIANGQPSQGSFANCASGHDHDGNCVDCWDSSHCTGGNVCLSNTCSAKIANGQPNQGSYTNCASGHDHDGNCVQCNSHDHCGANKLCFDHTCHNKIADGQPDRGHHTHCASGHNHDGNCVQCWDSSHCTGDNVCLNNTCSAKAANGQSSHGSSNNCASGRHHDGNCVDCWDSSHCTGRNVCLSNTCSAKIANGQPDQGSYTNCASGHNHDGNCVECWDSSHCNSNAHCSQYSCQPILNGEPKTEWKGFSDNWKCLNLRRGQYCTCASGSQPIVVHNSHRCSYTNGFHPVSGCNNGQLKAWRAGWKGWACT